MLHDAPCNLRGEPTTVTVDQVSVRFSLAGRGTKVSTHALYALLDLITRQLGDYGYFTSSGQFCSQGNLFFDFKSLISEVDITPRQSTTTSSNVVDDTYSSLPNNPAFNLFLASLAPRLTNSYIVTRVVQCFPCNCRP